MTLRELKLHQRSFGLGYHLRSRGTGYSLLSIGYGDEIECPDIDALELCVKNELEARNQMRREAACSRRVDATKVRQPAKF
jgi:hypothetical protein